MFVDFEEPLGEDPFGLKAIRRAQEDFISAYVPNWEFMNYLTAMQEAIRMDREAAELLMDSLMEGGVV